jgi:alpha-L-fucosidase
MKILKMLLAATLALPQCVLAQPMQAGRYLPTDESLKTHVCPDWFRDAKFGIWSHWGPQAVPRQGDWYACGMYERDFFDCARNEYRQAHRYYAYHVKHYGHPSEFGYKDIIPLWKAERWDPDALMKLYKRVGARYFVSMGVHHDNFFLWNSKIHRWNSVEMGPKKDVVGLWQAAAKREGLYFGVSEHLGASYTWFQTAHLSDQVGERAGIPYDGADPRYEDLYHAKAEEGDNGWYTTNPVWQQQWFGCIRELVDMYKPDLLYSDGPLPFGNDVGRSLIAHYYNSTEKSNRAGVVYTCKHEKDGRAVNDRERSVGEDIPELPWQTDTSIGDWYYRTGQKYMTGEEVIQMLVDIVSKNGNLLLNVVQTPEGDLEDDVMQILEYIAAWMADNSEAIYGTRPWKVYGEGPSTETVQEASAFGGIKDVRPYSAGDLRFTQKGKTVYVFAMVKPMSDISIRSLGLKSPTGLKIKKIRMLADKRTVGFTQTDDELRIEMPANLPDYSTVVFALER